MKKKILLIPIFFLLLIIFVFNKPSHLTQAYLATGATSQTPIDGYSTYDVPISLIDESVDFEYFRSNRFGDCIESLDEFMFNKEIVTPETPTLELSSPWEFIVDLDEYDINIYDSIVTNVDSNGAVRFLFYGGDSCDDVCFFYPQTQKILPIQLPDEIENFSYRKILSSPNNQLWLFYFEKLETKTLLSFYLFSNDFGTFELYDTQKFEVFNQNKANDNNFKIDFHSNDTIIFSHVQNGFYEYSIKEKQLNLIQKNFDDSQIIISEHYFFILNRFINVYSESDIIAINRKNKQVFSFDSPNNIYGFNFFYEDSSKSLWNFPVGYFDENFQWHQIYNSPNDYLIDIMNYRLFSAAPIYHSSNEIVWLQRFTEGVAIDGFGWFDPISLEGCRLLDKHAIITEDSNRVLWVIIDDHVYSLDLDSIQ